MSLLFKSISKFDKYFNSAPVPSWIPERPIPILSFLLFTQMGKQLESFKNYLEDFATKHKSDIKKNPEFRGHFQKMCARIGVDPLACK